MDKKRARERETRKTEKERQEKQRKRDKKARERRQKLERDIYRDREKEALTQINAHKKRCLCSHRKGKKKMEKREITLSEEKSKR